MTAFELEQLYPLRRSVKYMRDKILTLTMAAESATSILTGMPHGSGTYDKVGSNQAKIHDLRKRIEKEETEIKRLETFLSNISDTQTRLILQMRYDYQDVKPYWKDIAAFIGGGNTEGSVKMIAKRFLDDSEPCYECYIQAQNM